MTSIRAELARSILILTYLTTLEMDMVKSTGIIFKYSDGTRAEFKLDPNQTLRPGNVSPSYKLKVEKNDSSS